MCTLNRESGIKTVEDCFASKRPVKIAAIGPGTSTSDVSKLLKGALGLPTSGGVAETEISYDPEALARVMLHVMLQGARQAGACILPTAEQGYIGRFIIADEDTIPPIPKTFSGR